MHIRTICWALTVVLASCGGSQPPQPTPASPPAGDPAHDGSGRKALSQVECEAQGGAIVGDIGDGATHRPDYVCPSGKPPLGNVAPPEGGPIAVEGAVCCPR